MSNYTVYMHQNKTNGKVYIGQTCQTLDKRWLNGEGYRTSRHFYSAIKKYGWNGFTHIILQTGLTSEEADFYEQKYIEEYQSMNQDFGYNLRSGGKNAFIVSGNCIQKEKTKRGAEHPHSRKVRCKETGDVFASITSAEYWADSTKVGNCCRGQRQHAGTNPITGLLVSWEYAEDDAIITIECNEPVKNRHNKVLTQVVCVNTGKIFDTVKDAANWASIKDPYNIHRCCKGERQTSGRHPETKERLKWQYYNEERE